MSTDYTDTDYTDTDYTDTSSIMKDGTITQKIHIYQTILEKIQHKQKLHYVASMYYKKYHRIFHISHLFLNLLLFTFISYINTYNMLNYIGIGLQGLNTFWTQLEAFFGFNKWHSLHDKISNDYRTLIAQIEVSLLNKTFNDNQLSAIQTQYLILEESAPDFPRKIAENFIPVSEYIDDGGTF
jgi:hypothetical protein